MCGSVPGTRHTAHVQLRTSARDGCAAGAGVTAPRPVGEAASRSLLRPESPSRGAADPKSGCDAPF